LNHATSEPAGFIRRHFAIATILVLALALRLWHLDRNGYGTEYYAAGVRSMMASWHNFFFTAFDPGGFVSLDKPPVAFWIQTASAKLLGFSGFSLLLPQVLEGCACILILHHLVRRRFGAAAGLLAALFLAVTPISVAVDRANNTDACLVFILLLSGWAMSLAAERGNWRWLAVALALAGVGFNVKMLAACVVLPGFAALYLYGAPISLMRRVVHLAGAGLVFAVIALSWCVAYDLTSPQARPFVDSTVENSMLELVIGHNGVQRFLPALHRSEPAPAAAPLPTPDPAAAAAEAARRQATIAAVRRADNPPAGILRLAKPHLAGQVLWLLPLALIGFAAALRQSGLRRPLAPESASLLLWFGWALTYGVVFSAAGGTFHAYYVVTMAPPLAALAAIGATRLWARGGRAALLLPAALAATAAWQAYIESFYLGGWDWRQWLFGVLIIGSGFALIGLLVVPLLGRWPESSRRLIARGAFAIGLAALLVTPLAWALSTVLVRGGLTVPATSLALLVPPDELPDLRPIHETIDPPPPAKLTDFLSSHRQGATFLVGVLSARRAASLIIATGEPVMAIGGYTGIDPILTPEQLAALVAQNRLRYVLLGAPDGLDRIYGTQAVQKPLIDWILAKGVAVDPAEWRSQPAPAPADEPPRDPTVRHHSEDLNSGTLFDLRPGSTS
jgi:4-amino-4-deoxy-L-arabinose transferase-like glycosyltransferase